MDDLDMVERSKHDTMLNAFKNQGYVPKDCYISGFVVMALVQRGENPCAGCHLNREICGSKIPDSLGNGKGGGT